MEKSLGRLKALILILSIIFFFIFVGTKVTSFIKVKAENYAKENLTNLDEVVKKNSLHSGSINKSKSKNTFKFSGKNLNGKFILFKLQTRGYSSSNYLDYNFTSKNGESKLYLVSPNLKAIELEEGTGMRVKIPYTYGEGRLILMSLNGELDADFYVDSSFGSIKED